jgi:signal transduction histidine kinase
VALILVLILCALLALLFDRLGLFGDAAGFQVMVGFVIPAIVMVIFWRAARSRVLRHEASTSLGLRLEQVQSRATERFLADVAHALTPRRERCSARDESVMVAVEYQEAGADIKVAVPDVEIETDGQILGQMLHVLVGNAIRHGGGRVAIWAVTEGQTFRLTVSDDGAGLPIALGDAVFDRYVDLGATTGSPGLSGSGLALARALGEKIGAELGYKRDPSWSHFSVRLPLETEPSSVTADRVALEAGVR